MHQSTLEDAGNASSGPKSAGKPTPIRPDHPARHAPVDLASRVADAAGELLAVTGRGGPASSGRARRHARHRWRPDHPAGADPETDRRARQRSGSNSATRRDGWGQTRSRTSRGGEGVDLQGLACRRESSGWACACGSGRALRLCCVAEGFHRPLRPGLVEPPAEAMERDVVLAAELGLGQAALAIAADDLGPVGRLVGGPGHHVVSRWGRGAMAQSSGRRDELEDGVYRTHTSTYDSPLSTCPHGSCGRDWKPRVG